MKPIFFSLFVILWSCMAPATLWSQEARSISYLFIGDQDSNETSIRATSLAQHLGPQGIHLNYTTDLNTLTPGYLGLFDGIIIHAAPEQLTSNQEAALLQFIEGGKGLLAIHHASAAFQQNPSYSRLIGAQYASEEPDTLSPYLSGTAHPVTAGLPPFATPDILIRHTFPNPDRNILMEQPGAGNPEPVTWTRTQGDGRIVYTSLGGSDDTWSQRTFFTLLQQAILWTAGQQVVSAWAIPGRSPLTYETPEVAIPNYEQRPDPPQLQRPLSPGESMDYMQVAPGLNIDLFASEPQIVNPIAMAFDEWGRLWVAETVDYPNSLQAPGAGNDRIKILEDTDDDGQADRITVFADDLSIPTGFTFANGGVIVASAPDMLFLRDLDGDDVADERSVLFTGFGTFDTHAGPSNLRYGFDNWIWATIGYAGFEGEVGGKQHRFGQGIFRFKPDGSALEFINQNTNNTWGLGFSEEGDLFTSTANNLHSVHVAIPISLQQNINGFVRNGSAGIAAYKRFHPITDKYHQVDVFGGYTAAAGHALYTARNFPNRYWNSAAFVAEPTGHLVHQGFLNRSGSGFVMEDGWNLMAGADQWTSPVAAEVGPDGAVWILDWYSPIIQHNPTPEGFEAGAGNAYITPLRDNTHGRIYRISFPGGRSSDTYRLSTNTDRELLEALQHDNLFWRLTAQRLLVQRNRRDIVPDMLEIIRDPWMDDIGINGGATHAIGTLSGLGVLDGSDSLAYATVQDALGHPAAGVRRAALRALAPTPDLWEVMRTHGMLADPDPGVILESLLTLSQIPPDPSIGQELYALQYRPDVEQDRWLPHALAIAAAAHAEGYMRAMYTDPRANLVQNNTPLFIPNAGFEEYDTEGFTGWTMEIREGDVAETPASVASYRQTVGRSGQGLELRSEEGGDFGFYTEVRVKPFTDYVLGGWIKTENVIQLGLEGAGAVLAIPGVGRSADLKGTNDWTWAEISFNSGNRNTIRVMTYLGRWGLFSGVAWFDDLRLVERGTVSPGVFVAETVVRHLALEGRGQSMSLLVQDLESASPAVQNVVLSALTDVWPAGQKPPLDETAILELNQMMPRLAPYNAELLSAFMAKWETPEAPTDFPAPTVPSSNPPLPEPLTGPQEMISIQLTAVSGAMRFSQDTIRVAAGQPISLTFTNDDNLPHNLIFTAPGMLDAVGEAADAMALEEDGEEKSYIPEMDAVLYSVDLIAPEENVTLIFPAPSEPGIYPFVCTYPGHWRTMNGVLVVE